VRKGPDYISPGGAGSCAARPAWDPGYRFGLADAAAAWHTGGH